MEKPISKKERKELQKKLLATLKGQISHLSQEFQEILADDLVTALQNRLVVLTHIQAKRSTANPRNLL